MEYNLALDVWMAAIIALPIFWLLSYVRYNQLAHIERLPLLLLLVWSIPVLIVIHMAARTDPIYNTILFGCIAIWIMSGLIEATCTGRFDRIRLKDTHPTRKERQAARKQAEQDAANPAYVRESEMEEGVFEVVGDTRPNGSPYPIYHTRSRAKADRMAAERSNKGVHNK